MSIISSHLQFPNSDALTRAFFEEGIRHLEDARILHEASRHPAAIASAMKAAEFGVKSLIILSGAMGWWDRVFTTHSPLGDIEKLIAFQPHVDVLRSYHKTLVADVIAMEKLATTRPGGSYDLDAQKNPEYPFLSYQPASGTEAGGFRLDKPSTYFGEVDSRSYHNTAQDLLTTVAAQYAVIGGWGIAIPASL